MDIFITFVFYYCETGNGKTRHVTRFQNKVKFIFVLKHRDTFIYGVYMFGFLILIAFLMKMYPIYDK